MRKVSPLRYLAPLMVIVIASCGDSPKEGVGEDGSHNKQTAIAFVNDTPITQQQLESARSRFNVAGKPIDARFDDTLTKSLVNSRAIALLAQKEIDELTRDSIEQKVHAYREELLVKEYLKRHAEPQPVTSSMVEDYYESHPEDFSGGTRKEFEYFITTKEDLTEEERKQVLEFFANVKTEAAWGNLHDPNQQLPLMYRKANARVGLLEQPLKTLVDKTPAETVSSVHMGARIVVVRVLREETISPKPLAEVSAEIRKKLAPIQLKKAVKEVSEKALDQVSVTYPNSNK